MTDEARIVVRPPQRRAKRHSGLTLTTDLSDARLLKLRLGELGLRIEGTTLQKRIARVHAELQQRGVRFRPHYWLSGEWFTPDGVPGIALPFYLAHPRLERLEKKFLFEAEGGDEESCLRILRHEIGHAIDNAYRLHRRDQWRKLFGRYTQRYPRFYRPNPYTKRFVVHLDHWYAQSHPAEDFAETFAVWLTPNSPWRETYADWPALKKLKYVDRLMAEIGSKSPPVRSRRKIEPLTRLTMTLGEYYDQKRAAYAAFHPAFYDHDLHRLFPEAKGSANGEPAAKFLRRQRADLRRLVARWTGEHRYTIDRMLEEMIVRCGQLRLRRNRPEREARLETAVLVSVQTMNHLHAGHHRLAL